MLEHDSYYTQEVDNCCGDYPTEVSKNIPQTEVLDNLRYVDDGKILSLTEILTKRKIRLLIIAAEAGTGKSVLVGQLSQHPDLKQTELDFVEFDEILAKTIEEQRNLGNCNEVLKWRGEFDIFNPTSNKQPKEPKQPEEWNSFTNNLQVDVLKRLGKENNLVVVSGLFVGKKNLGNSFLYSLAQHPDFSQLIRDRKVLILLLPQDPRAIEKAGWRDFVMSHRIEDMDLTALLKTELNTQVVWSQELSELSDEQKNAELYRLIGRMGPTTALKATSDGINDQLQQLPIEKKVLPELPSDIASSLPPGEVIIYAQKVLYDQLLKEKLTERGINPDDIIIALNVLDQELVTWYINSIKK